MFEENDSIQPGLQRRGDPIPYVTQFVCAVCGLIFIGLNLEKSPVDNPIFQWAVPSAIEIFAGRYWGLLTAPFVHIEIWHVAFNVYWFWILGRAVEREIGRIGLILLVVFSAVTAAGAELAVADTTGIGLSGVVYGVFGFMWMGSRRIRAFEDLLPRQTVVIFLVWLVACYIATELKVMNIANAAHLFGMLFGMAAGEAFVNRRRIAVMVLAMALMIGGAVTACFWNPWSPMWLGEKALKAHKAKDYPTAIAYYRKFIARGRNSGWALYNLAVLYSEMKDQPNFEKTLDQLRKVDPESAKKFDPEPVEDEPDEPPAKGK
jgi:GlpG protein